MLKTVLLVLGENGADHAAVDLAIRWARDYGLLLAGLGIVDETVAHPREAVPLGAGESKRELDAARLAKQRSQVERSLAALAARCAHEKVAFKPLEDIGQPTAEILLEAQRYDLIVMPRYAHYFHAAMENGLGTTLWHVVRAAPRPVVAVPEQAVVAPNIVIAYDGSLQATRALQNFVATGLAAGRDVHVVALDAERRDAARCGDRAVDFLDHHGIAATLHAETGNPRIAECIMQQAHQLNAGLLVMGAYGQPWACEFVLGSVTRSLMAACNIPLFLYH